MAGVDFVLRLTTIRTMNGHGTDRAAAVAAHWAGMEAADRADEMRWARQMGRTDGMDDDRTAEDVEAEAMEAAWAGSDGGRAEQRENARRAADERRAAAEADRDCSECGQAADHRARVEMGEFTLCHRCVTDETAAERQVRAAARAAGMMA